MKKFSIKIVAVIVFAMLLVLNVMTIQNNGNASLGVEQAQAQVIPGKEGEEISCASSAIWFDGAEYVNCESCDTVDNKLGQEPYGTC